MSISRHQEVGPATSCRQPVDFSLLKNIQVKNMRNRKTFKKRHTRRPVDNFARTALPIFLLLREEAKRTLQDHKQGALPVIPF